MIYFINHHPALVPIAQAIPMIISEPDIILIIQLFLEVKIMWILTSIFQAIGQAITRILPISESGHSAIFHDFSNRFTNSCSQLTGVIHIGIALGIIIAFYRLFLKLGKNFFMGWNDLFHKRLDLKNISPQRKFMYMTIISFVPMILYAIPIGKHGSFFSAFHRMSYNGSLLGEGICFTLTGVMIICTVNMIGKSSKKIPWILQSVIIGIVAFLALPTAGCSLVAGVFCICIIVGLNDKYAVRYAMVITSMSLLIGGIVEICVGVTKVSIISAIIGLVISAVVSFFAVKLLLYIIKNNALKYFAWYDIAIGIICFIIGIFEIITK